MSGNNRLSIWKDEKEAQKNLSERLRNCRDDRQQLEVRWRNNERTVYNTTGDPNTNNQAGGDPNIMGQGAEGVDNSSQSVGINYAFKNFRFIHAQLSANPPSVTPNPTSNDPEDRRRADAADRLIRYAMREYDMQEVVDRTSLNTLLYGTGFTKTIWDTSKGDPIELDEETGEFILEGDFNVSVPNVWNIFVDPDATQWKDVRYVFEKIVVPFEDAVFKYPEKIEILKTLRKAQLDEYNSAEGNRSAIRDPKYDVVELYEYWEKGTPTNGFIGRFCVCTEHGQLITPIMENPEQYKPKETSPVGVAVLPYQIFTDIDVPNMIWGKSFVEYVVSLQDKLNKIDTVTLENAEAHGVSRMILPEGTEIADDSITNSPWDIIKITGSQPPHFMAPMPLPQIMPDLMQRYKGGVDELSGVNEAMFGQQSRETSGFSMQYATTQGNMIRRRLSNKYVTFVEAIYNAYLRILKTNWDIPRTVRVLGKEKAFESTDIKGADIMGGYDLVVQYGRSLSLDPNARREEIMTLLPIFEKAGVEPRQIMQMLKLNELGNIYDILDLAKDRQREIFEEMIAKGIYIAPKEMQDHQNMYKFCEYYLMTSEFKYLNKDDQVLIERHVKERKLLLEQGLGLNTIGSGNPPGPAPTENPPAPSPVTSIGGITG